MSNQRAQWKARAAECLQMADSALAQAEAAETEELRANLLLLAQESLKLVQEIEAMLGKM